MLLYPARGWPHKNHAMLFEAWQLLRTRRPELELVLTGAHPDELPTPPPGVQVRGLVSRSELVDLYGRAAALVFPSRYEGFGLPLLEAMATGCPVAAARAGSLPEVVGDAGVLFDPDDPEAFSWSACADVHERVYRKLGA
jgi:glycosyltransferase involved in cell wall biosynthesis